MSLLARTTLRTVPVHLDRVRGPVGPLRYRYPQRVLPLLKIAPPVAVAKGLVAVAVAVAVAVGSVVCIRCVGAVGDSWKNPRIWRPLTGSYRYLVKNSLQLLIIIQ